MRLDLSRFWQSQDTSLKSVFLYGTDDYYLDFCIQQQQHWAKPEVDIKRVDTKEFITQKDTLTRQTDLFAAKSAPKLIIIRDATDKLAKHLDEYLLTAPDDTLVALPCIVGTSVRKLKTMHEKTAGCAFVSCYLDKATEKQTFIQVLLKKFGLQLDREALSFAMHRLEEDPSTVEADFRKLQLYNDQVTLQDYQDCVVDASSSSIEQLAFALGGRQHKTFLTAYKRAKADGVDDIYMARAITGHFVKLMALANAVDRGTPVQDALKTQRPPIFFKYHDTFKQHLRQWNPTQIARMITALQDTERLCKSTSAIDPMHNWRSVLRVA
ncbi:MAG: DNA polymerase III subunit delta [Alphaproteobacteria bacterium]